MPEELGHGAQRRPGHDQPTREGVSEVVRPVERLPNGHLAALAAPYHLRSVASALAGAAPGGRHLPAAHPPALVRLAARGQEHGAFAVRQVGQGREDALVQRYAPGLTILAGDAESQACAGSMGPVYKPRSDSPG